ncbi:MAG: hypothetical protein KC613_10610, partial [Myxococcales bacterium]|nr:hypothetical protein [Myxococcales bacterium]
ADERCDDGACVPVASECTDACDTDGALECDADGTGFRRCGQYDADPCRELSERVPCAGFERCEAGACVPVCEDACEAGATRCGPNGVELCGNFDADPCLEFSPGMACPMGERCDNGACVAVEQPCEDACEAGALRCSGDGVQICADQDEDPCTEWSAAVPCGAGERCEGEGACVPDCMDECMPGAVRCEAGGTVICADHDGDGCLEFGDNAPCPDGQSCSNGACRVDCVDDCQMGATDCVPEGLRRCGQFDADACLDWSGPTPCGPAQACQAGACVAVCDDECVEGQRRCLGEGFEVCGDFDADPCLEFGGGAACGAAEACMDGACQIQCDDECAPNDTECVDAGNRRSCGNFDADPCLEFGGAEACAANETCQGDACVARPAPQGVVINELLYDADGGDQPSVFTELWGPPGTDLTGMALVGVNGANGSAYARVDLVGAIPADGYFVVAHTNASPELAAVADQRHASADFQNGPDNLQLRFGDQVLDAVGYGVFGPGETFAGEGEPVAEPAVGMALTRNADHRDTDDNAVDFAEAAPSPGAGLACADACDLDAVQCSGAVAERCVRGAAGCTEWATAADCAADGGACVDGACQGMACLTPGTLGAWTPLPGLFANHTCLDALPRAGGGWAIAAGNPGEGVTFGLVDGAGAFTAGPHTLGTTNYPPWGNSASSVYYPSLTQRGGQYAVTWSIFSDQGNRDIAFRRVTEAGQPVPRNNPVISTRKGFSPQVRPTATGFRVLYNAYRQLQRIELDDLGAVQGAQQAVGAAHGDTREETFLAWLDGPGGLVAYAVNTVDFQNPRFFVQPLTDGTDADGARIDLGPAMVSSGHPNAFLFRLGADRFGVFWRSRLADAVGTEALNYAIINRRGVIERQVQINELDRPDVYKPEIRPLSIGFDGERFAIYHERWFDQLEANHFVIQWMSAEGVPLGRADLAQAGKARLFLHPDTGWHLIKSGEPIAIAPLGCE